MYLSSSCNSARPYDVQELITYGDIYDYIEEMVEILLKIADSEDLNISRAALDSLPKVISEAAIMARPERAVEQFSKLVDWAINSAKPVSIPELLEKLRFTAQYLKIMLDAAGQDYQKVITKHIEDCNMLIQSLYNSNFQIHFKIAISENNKIENISKEITEQPDLLTEGLIQWLCEKEATYSGAFCFNLGKFDVKRVFVDRIDKIGRLIEGCVVFSCYYWGMAINDIDFVKKRLDNFIETGDILATNITETLRHFCDDPKDIERIILLLKDGKISREYLTKYSHSTWITYLGFKDFIKLLEAIAGDALEYSHFALDIIGMWLYYGKGLDEDLTEFTWQCLEAGPKLIFVTDYDCDNIACFLTKHSPDRGYALFEKLLNVDNEESEIWNPIGGLGIENRGFWNMLKEINYHRALNIIYKHFLKNKYFLYSGYNIINQETEFDQLLDFGLEDESKALFIIRLLSSGEPNFWYISLHLFDKFIDVQEIKQEIRHKVINDINREILEKNLVRIQELLEKYSFSYRIKSFLRSIENEIKDNRTSA